jgi:signal transduction histidine kinase
MTDSAEKMNALVQLAGTIAHELNNIFTAVSGNITLLDQEKVVPENQDVSIKDIARAAQRGVELTAKLQAFAGRQRLNRRYVDLNSLVLKTMHSLRSTIPHVHVSILLADESFVVFLDEEKLSETIAELVKNAVEAMPQTGGHITIETSCLEEDQHYPRVLLKLKDSGQGMAPEVVVRATEPLFTTCSRGVKSGWGLSKCSGFVRQSGGRMMLSSKLGQGTVVTIELPLATKVNQLPK